MDNKELKTLEEIVEAKPELLKCKKFIILADNGEETATILNGDSESLVRSISFGAMSVIKEVKRGLGNFAAIFVAKKIIDSIMHAVDDDKDAENEE